MHRLDPGNGELIQVPFTYTIGGSALAPVTYNADFPGCITAGKTLEEAHRMAAEALALHIAGMVEDGDAIPEPSTLDALAEDPAREGAVAFLVRVEPETERTVRINITARKSRSRKSTSWRTKRA